MAPTRYLLLSMYDDWTWLANMQLAARNGYKAALARGEFPPYVSYPEEFHQRRGFLLVVDFSEQRVLGVKELPLPAGVAVEDKRLIVTNWATQGMAVIEADAITRSVSLPLFNNLHSIHPVFPPGPRQPGAAPRSYLVASKGTECILDVGLDGEIRWSWFAFENGFDTTPSGQKIVFDKERDWRRLITSTLAQATHVNSAVPLDDGSVLACLPIQGSLVRIERATGKNETVLRGLELPHSIRRSGAGFTVCDTKGQRVVWMDSQFLHQTATQVGAPWLMDCHRAEDGSMFVVSNQNWPSPGSADVSRVLALDPEGRLKTTMVFRKKPGASQGPPPQPGNYWTEGGDLRVSEIHELTQAQAEYWAHAWRSHSEALDAFREHVNWQSPSNREPLP